MSVENISVIDAASIDKEGNLVLSISDHLEWDLENTHLLKLQDKLNAYLNAIENGSLSENYPDAENRSIVIDIFFKYSPNETAGIFLQRARQTIEAAGYGFTFCIHND